MNPRCIFTTLVEGGLAMNASIADLNQGLETLLQWYLIALSKMSKGLSNWSVGMQSPGKWQTDKYHENRRTNHAKVFICYCFKYLYAIACEVFVTNK